MKANPAIRTLEHERDTSGEEVVQSYYSSVSFVRGLGDSGQRVERVVGPTCPNCGEDRLGMVRRWRVMPEDFDELEYWCLNPACNHYLSDNLSWAIHKR